MNWLDLISIVAAMGVVATFSGRVLAGALNLTLVRTFGPTNAAASAILGAAGWIVGFGWLSSAGLPAPRTVSALGAAYLLALLVAWRRGTLSFLRPRGPALDWALLIVVLFGAAIVSLLPVLRTGGYSLCNDTYHYAAFSEWLQHAGWGTRRPFDPRSPATYIPALFQDGGSPLGAAYAVALVQAATSAVSTLLVYPAVSAFGMALNAATVVLTARLVFRLRTRAAVAAGLGFVLLPHPLYWGHHNGFLQQTYALPVLLLAIGLLAQLLRPTHWRPRNGALLALLVQYLLVVYLPAVPLLAVAFFPYAVASLRRARARGVAARWLRAGATGLLLAVVFGARELRAVLPRLFEFASAVVGWHVPLGPREFFELAVGARIYGPPWTDGALETLRQFHLWLTPLYLVLVCVGLHRAVKLPRARSFLAPTLTLAAGLAYYGLLVPDPWTHARGHTWSLFKLTQYAYPFVYLLLAVGVHRAARALSLGRMALAGLATGALALGFGLHWGWSASGESLRLLVRADHPLPEIARARRRFQGLPQGTLVVLGRPGDRHNCLASVLALLAYPRTIVGEWEGSGHVPPLPHFTLGSYLDRPWEDGPDQVVPILFEKPFEAEGIQDLGGGFWTIPRKARVLRVRSARPRDARIAEGRVLWKGQARLRWLLYSPEAGPGALVLAVATRPAQARVLRLGVQSLGGDLFGRSLRDSAHEEPRDVVLVGPGAARLSFPIQLHRGLTTVVLSALGEAGDPESTNGLVIEAASVGPR